MKWNILDGWWSNAKVLFKIKEIIDIEKFDYTKICIDTDDKFLDDYFRKIMWY